MNKAAMFLWVLVIIILGSGFYGLYALTAIAGAFLLLVIICYLKELFRRPTEEQQKEVLKLLAEIDNEEEFNKEHQLFVKYFGYDPGSFSDFKQSL